MPVIAPSAGRLRPLMLLALAGGVLAAATGILWAWYGTTVFFEAVRAGWVACF